MRHKVKKVELERLEGYTHLFKNGNPTKEIASYEEANKLLFDWSATAPKDGGYDKCRFIVTFNDPEESTYEGRYDLKHFTCTQDEGESINLRKRIRDFLDYLVDEEGSDEAKQFIERLDI